MGVIEREVRSQEELRNAYMEMIPYGNFERCLAEMHAFTGKELFYYYGECDVCNSPQPFIVDYQFAEEMNGKKAPNWRERLVCPNCGCNSRERFMIRRLFEEYRPGMQVLLYEQVSNFMHKIQREIPSVRGFEYPGAHYRGENPNQGIWCEDICNLSFGDEEFDILEANDTFVSVYNYERAFSEAYRILKPGGKLLFTVPFDGNSAATVRRVRVTEDGLEYTEPAWFRGNAVPGEKPLPVYEVFGWDLLDTLKKCGFSYACGKVYYGLKAGYMGYLPMYFEAHK
jgi:SAM-dependent methyltransferase